MDRSTATILIRRSRNLVEIDPVAKTATSVTFGSSMWGIAIHPDGSTLYVTDRSDDVVHVVDVATLSVTQTVDTGDDPWGIDITPNGDNLVVINEDSGTVTFIVTATLVATNLTLPSGAAPRDVELTNDGMTAYVASGDLSGADMLYELDVATATMAGSISLGSGTMFVNANVVSVAPPLDVCTL